MMINDPDAVCFMIMLVQWIIWSMLSVMMLDDHDAVCCMIMLVLWIIWSMLSMMMLDDHDAVCCMIMFGVWVIWSMLSMMIHEYCIPSNALTCLVIKCLCCSVDMRMSHVSSCNSPTCSNPEQ